MDDDPVSKGITPGGGLWTPDVLEPLGCLNIKLSYRTSGGGHWLNDDLETLGS